MSAPSTETSNSPAPFNPAIPAGFKYTDHSDDPVDEELADAIYNDSPDKNDAQNGSQTGNTPVAGKNAPGDNGKHEASDKPENAPEMDDLVADRVRQLEEKRRDNQPAPKESDKGREEDDPDYKLPVPQFRKRYAELKRKVAELSEKLESAGPSPEIESIRSENEALKKKLDDLKQSEAVREYMESSEWERETAPLRQAHERLISLASRLVNPETEKPPTPAELAEVLVRARAAKSLRDLSEIVVEKLGEDARPVVVPAVMEIFDQEQRLARLQQEAGRRAEEWRKTERERRARAIAESSGPVFDMLGRGLGLTNEEMTEMQRATRSFDEVFTGGSGNSSRFAERIGKIRAYAASVPVLLGRIQRLQEEIEKSRQALKAYEDSRPTSRPRVKTPDRAVVPGAGDDDLESMARRLYGEEES